MEMLDTLYQFAKFQFECGNYSGSAEYLYIVRVLVGGIFCFVCLSFFYVTQSFASTVYNLIKFIKPLLHFVACVRIIHF